MTSILRTIARSASLRLAGALFGFLVGVQLARGLGPEGYGIYGMAMSVIAILTVPAQFGLPVLVTREVSVAAVKRNFDLMKGVLRWGARLTLRLSALIFCGASLWIWLSRDGDLSRLQSTLLIGLGLVPVVALTGVAGGALRGLNHIVRGQVPDILLRPALFSLTLLLLGVLPVALTPALAMAAGLVSSLVALAAAALFLWRAAPDELGAATAGGRSDAWWASAVPMAMTEGLRVLQGHLAILLVGLLASEAATGQFRVASSIVIAISLPVSLLNVVAAPHLARLYAEKDTVQLQQLLTRMAAGMFAGMLVLVLTLTLAGEFVLALVFGEEYIPAYAPLVVLAWGAVASAVFGLSATLLNMTGREPRVTRALAISLLALLVSGAVLAGTYGAMGAAIAVSSSLLLWNFLLWRDACRLLSLDASIGLGRVGGGFSSGRTHG